MELDLIAERTERDADQRIVERGDSGRWKSDRDWLQRELQRFESTTGHVLPERHAVRIRIGLPADSDANLHCNGDAHRDANGYRNSDTDSDDATNRYADANADCDSNSDCDANRYRNSDSDTDSHADSYIDIAADVDPDSGRTGELSRELLS